MVNDTTQGYKTEIFGDVNPINKYFIFDTKLNQNKNC